MNITETAWGTCRISSVLATQDMCYELCSMYVNLTLKEDSCLASI